MRAILRKELRENAKWAVLALVPTVATADFGVHYDETLVLSGLIAGALAFCFGLLQTVLEARQNQWAFLIHRAVSASRIWLAKTIVGLGLYLLVTCGPVLMVAITYSMAGIERLPWHWTMILPRLALILAGAGFYWCGTLVALGQARWYGSRVLPLALPALCLLVVTHWLVQINQFVSAGLIAFIFAVNAVMAIAAWGSFVNSGETRGQPMASLIALGASLFTAMLGLVLTGFGLPLAIIAESRLGTTRPESSTYRVDRQGEVWLFRWGRSAWTEQPPVLGATNVDAPSRSLDAAEIDAKWTELPLYHFRYRRLFFGRAVVAMPQRIHAEGSPLEWSFVPAHGLFVGYRHEGGILPKQLARWAGPDGFFPALAKPARQFGQFWSGSWTWNYHWDQRELPTGSMRLDRQLLVFTEGIYEIDFARETIKRLGSATNARRSS